MASRGTRGPTAGLTVTGIAVIYDLGYRDRSTVGHIDRVCAVDMARCTGRYGDCLRPVYNRVVYRCDRECARGAAVGNRHRGRNRRLTRIVT